MRPSKAWMWVLLAVALVVTPVMLRAGSPPEESRTTQPAKQPAVGPASRPTNEVDYIGAAKILEATGEPSRRFSAAIRQQDKQALAEAAQASCEQWKILESMLRGTDLHAQAVIVIDRAKRLAEIATSGDFAAAEKFGQTPWPGDVPFTLNKELGRRAQLQVDANITTEPAIGPGRFMGVLFQVEGNTLTVEVSQRWEKKHLVVTTDENTQFSIDVSPGKLADLKPGMDISVTQTPAGGRMPAMVIVMAISPHLSGTVLRMDGANLILRALGADGRRAEVPVATDEKTRVTILATFGPGGAVLQEPREAKLEDLRAGTTVKVIPQTGTARTIIVGYSPGVREGPATTQPDEAALEADRVGLVRDEQRLSRNLQRAMERYEPGDPRTLNVQRELEDVRKRLAAFDAPATQPASAPAMSER